MLASLTNVNKFYNGNQVLKNVSLSIDESDRIGLVGNNGCGKSTLLKILTGSVEPDRFTEKDGVISMAAKTTVGYLEQMGGLNTENTVLLGEAVRLNGACEYFQKRGLAAAVIAHKADPVAFINGKRDIFQHLISVIELVYIR